MEKDFRQKLIELIALEASIRDEEQRPLKSYKKANPKWKLMPLFFIGLIVMIWSYKVFKAPNEQIFDLFIDIFALLFILIGLCAALWGALGLIHFIDKLKLGKTNAMIKQMNNNTLAQRENNYQKFLKLQNELIELKKNTPGMENAFYFFEAPFDRSKTLRDLDLPDAKSLQADKMAFVVLESALKFTRENNKLIYRGHKDIQPLKLEQLKPYLLGGNNKVLFLDHNYMIEHKDDDYLVHFGWEYSLFPDYQYRTVYHHSTINAQSAMEKYERNFDDLERKINYGFTNDEAYISGQKSYWDYLRDENIREKAKNDLEQEISSYNASSATRDLNAVGMKLMMIHSGYAISCNNRIVAILLAPETSELHFLEYSYFKEVPFDMDPQFEGLVQKYDAFPAKPSYSNLIQHICKDYSKFLPAFDPLCAKPDGVSLELWRCWMEQWYRAKV